MLGLEHLLDRRPAALSGGQRQRVAMGRAIVREPRVFLMDEPLSNLDAKLRVTVRAQLTLLHHRLGVTTVYVTHDQIEAMTLGQRVDTEATRAAFAARSSDDALLLADEARARFTARLPADVPLPIGEPLTVSVDPRRLYFFDPDTGEALRKPGAGSRAEERAEER